MELAVFESSRSPWQKQTGPEQDIILSSRIRLARNLKDCIFPDHAPDEVLAAVLKSAAEGTERLNSLQKGCYVYFSLEDIDDLQREMLVEKHMVTANHIARPKYRGVLLRQDEAVSIMINEEDHFRIQTVSPGLALEAAWSDASAVDDALESTLNFAFRDDFGYLTANPANAGTGLMASVTMHLPALIMLKRFSRFVQGVTQLGYSVRALYSTGTESVGNVFQISNQIRLGLSEPAILEQLGKIAGQIAEEERNCRAILWEHTRNTLQDRLCRAYGVLTQAWMLEEQEALSFLSDMRLGADLGVLPVAPQLFETLLAASQPGFLQSRAGETKLSAEEMDMLRAQVIKEMLTASSAVSPTV